VKCLSTVSAYTTDVPEFLHNRPWLFAKHCLCIYPPNMDDNSLSNTSTNATKIYNVRSNNHHYEANVSIRVPTCQCIDCERNFLSCKHVVTLIRHFGRNCLLSEYRQFPLFTIDDEIQDGQQYATMDTVESQGDQPMADVEMDPTVACRVCEVHMSP